MSAKHQKASGTARMREWREDHRGFIHSKLRATAWMFGGLFFSHLAEFLLLAVARRAARPLPPASTYSPVFFWWLWRRSHI